MEKILVIDDDKNFVETVVNHLSQSNFKVVCASDGKSGLDLVSKEKPSVILTDLKMKGLDGLQVLQEIKNLNCESTVILITAFNDMEATIKAMQYGAYDYIEKSEGLEQISKVINRVIRNKKLNHELIISIPADNGEAAQTKRLIGRTPEMNDIFKKIGKVSSGKVTVLIQGKSGTGKEMIAQIIHYSGINKHHPFIPVNCSALSETLLESELFGHVKGSFTGAIRDKKGKFELAGKGTIFLDEISELSLNLQVKLLRVIQEREFEKVGGESSISMGARIIAATNRDLKKMVDEGKFREDLYYRLNVLTLQVPALRERKDDIPLLVVHFLQKINKALNKNVYKVPYEVMEILQNHNWQGNVRELENTLMEAVVLTQGNVLEKEYIKLNRQKKNEINFLTGDEILPLTEVEKIYIKNVLDKVKWNVIKASKLLGIAKTTLYYKISLYNLSK